LTVKDDIGGAAVAFPFVTLHATSPNSWATSSADKCSGWVPSGGLPGQRPAAPPIFPLALPPPFPIIIYKFSRPKVERGDLLRFLGVHSL
jgi:hypothetical protein